MTPCQPHEGQLNVGGYGYACMGGKVLLAHRLAWALHNGVDPLVGWSDISVTIGRVSHHEEKDLDPCLKIPTAPLA